MWEVIILWSLQDNRNPLWKNYQNTILLKITHLFLYMLLIEIFNLFRIVIIMSL